jgi:multicomponent Na+:H+ antiporter subunit A
MNSVIFKAASHIVSGMMLIFSVYLLLRGHNSPGGGFIAGLIAVIAFALLMLAESSDYVRQRLFFPPLLIAGGGIMLSLAMGTLPLFFGQEFLSGLWLTNTALGSPLLFDFGVYLAVFGSVLTILLNVEEELS